MKGEWVLSLLEKLGQMFTIVVNNDKLQKKLLSNC